MSQPRSYLFVPGNRPERFAKAAASGAHCIIIDLEDAVGPEDKDAARGHAVQWFADGGSGVVRVNGADTPWFEADLAALSNTRQAAVMVPKAEPESLAHTARRLPQRPLIALVETVSALIGLPDLVAVPGVERLAFGNLDFGIDARIPGAGPVLDPARFQIAIHSRQAGLPPPIDGVTVAIRDAAALRDDVARAKALGFTAKLCIHPSQVAEVNAGFAPAADEIDWARRIVAAAVQAGGAAVQVDGKMVDRPVLDRARAILAGIDG